MFKTNKNKIEYDVQLNFKNYLTKAAQTFKDFFPWRPLVYQLAKVSKYIFNTQRQNIQCRY